MTVVNHPLLSGKIEILVPLTKNLSADEIGDKALALTGLAQTLASSYVSSQPQRLTEHLSRSVTRQMEELIWSDYSKMAIELMNIAVQLKTLTNGCLTSLKIFVDDLPLDGAMFVWELISLCNAFTMDWSVELHNTEPDFYGPLDMTNEVFGEI